MNPSRYGPPITKISEFQPRLSDNSLQSKNIQSQFSEADGTLKAYHYKDTISDEMALSDKGSEHMDDSPNLTHSSDNDYDRIFNETFFSDQRKFSVFGNESSLKEFRSNKVQTSKYNFLTFLPLNLFYQFTKIANVYFAFQACL